jgi:hypothetical protein
MSGGPWSAPQRDGELFFHPDPEMWAASARASLKISGTRTFFGLTPAAVRREAGWPEGPVVLSAHQPVLFYPGLWVKALAASSLAAALGWTAVHKITDQDAPGEADGWVLQTTPDGLGSLPLKWSRPDQPYAFQNAPKEVLWAEALRMSDSAGLASVQEGTAFFSKHLQTTWAFVSDWDDWHEGCLRALDQVSGTERLIKRASHIWDQPSFRKFLAVWLSDAPAFCRAYNKALDRYRAEQNIQHPLTPVPNLAVEEGWLETPFWTVMPERGRETLWVKHGSGGVLLSSGRDGEVFHWDVGGGGEALAGAPWRLWPKALPQSLYTRLFLADFFIHGLGGGFYEPVNDLFLEELGLGLGAPFGVVSATLWLSPDEMEKIQNQLEKMERIPYWRRALEKNPEYLLQRQGDWIRELPLSLTKACLEASATPSFNEAVRVKAELLEALKDPKRRAEAGGGVKEWNSFWAERFAPLYASFEASQGGLEALKDRRKALSYRLYAFFCYSPGRFATLKESVDRMIRKG